MEKEINNHFYDDLEEEWYTSCIHPIALLRAENAARMPWILQAIETHFGKKSCSILDIGCGAGFLANTLALYGHKVSGIDVSEKSLKIAKEKDTTRSVNYLKEDAYALSFSDNSFDVICALDFLEHVEKPEKIIEKVSSLLREGGIFFYHTFNRNLLSYFFVIKGVEWFVKNTPKNMHIYRLFIKPQELFNMLKTYGLETKDIVGVSPHIKSRAFWKMLVTRKVPSSLKFKVHSSLMTGYLGMAKKSVLLKLL